jgi:hypothetical protein
VPHVENTIGSCRIKIEGKGMIFYDVSDFNFTISTDPFADLSEPVLQKGTFSVYPNPFSGKLYCKANGTASGRLLIGIYDLFGREIRTFHSENLNNDSALDLDSLEPGVYFLRLNSTEGSFTFKIIRQ